MGTCGRTGGHEEDRWGNGGVRGKVRGQGAGRKRNEDRGTGREGNGGQGDVGD